MVARAGVVFTQHFKIILKQLVPKGKGISGDASVRVDITCRVISNAVGTDGVRSPCYHFSYASFKGY